MEIISDTTNITVAYGDGIGAEIMEATLLVLREAGAKISIETIEIGQRIYNMDSKTGILRSAWDTLRRNKILLTAPIIMPEGLTLEGHERKHTKIVICEKFLLEMSYEEGEGAQAWESYVGEEFALFAATHEAMPEIAGKNKVNPSGMILAAVAMLAHIGDEKTAEKIKNAWQKTIDEGLHTADIYQRKISHKKLGTHEFAEEIVERLEH
jgi:isocitrate/isopropylmalate dehydrogenase